MPASDSQISTTSDTHTENAFRPNTSHSGESCAVQPASGHSGSVSAHEADATMQRGPDESLGVQNDQSCLVQIYPADVVDGMLLLETDYLLIGRDDEADLMLPDNSVSRRHAALQRTEQGFEIEDLGSTNGTFIDGQLIDRVSLSSGDTIRIGSFLFKFLSAGSVESQYHETVYGALTRDALTGTMNKRYLLETLDRAIATAVRQKSSVTVVMVDIDHFKAVNDTYGHLVGDEVLREFGRRVGEACREDDLLARYGGEEFCLLLSGTASEEATEVAERCRKTVCDTPFDTAAGPLEISASFGFACLDASTPESGTQLIGRADEKLYDAKHAGRNQVCG